MGVYVYIYMNMYTTKKDVYIHTCETKSFWEGNKLVAQKPFLTVFAEHPYERAQLKVGRRFKFLNRLDVSSPINPSQVPGEVILSWF